MPLQLKESNLRFAEVEVNVEGLDFYRRNQDLYQPLLEEVGRLADEHRDRLRQGTVWLVNSVAFGGGVAETLPHHIALLRDIGVDARWLVFQPDTDGFFGITKRVHNSLHGVDCGLDSNDFQLYDDVSRSCAEDLGAFVGDNDLLFIHDLQPVGVGSHFLNRNSIPSLWRCHIGHPSEAAAIETAWKFLEPYFASYDKTVFTAAPYSRPVHPSPFFVVPGLNPSSVKNRLPMKPPGPLAENEVLVTGLDGQARSVSTEWFERTTTGRYFLQVARWDALKGFPDAIESFSRFCRLSGTDHSDVELLLVGPDPAGIADDPEDLRCLASIVECFQAQAPDVQERIKIIRLSMEDNDRNAHLVGVLQARAYGILQLSSEEGYGLSLTEALIKAKPAIVRAAFGLMMQVHDGENGFVVGGDSVVADIGARMKQLADDPELAAEIGRRAAVTCALTATELAQIPIWIAAIDQLRHEALTATPV